MDYLDKNITTWSENLLKYKGFPRPFYYTNEKHHFKNKKLREKDIKRQKEIEEYLKCKFIRINEFDYE